jgi:uncharacterized protein YjbI with pentapeptide repeats
MSEFDTAASEGETPVNPYSLLEAVNASSDEAHVSWFVFLAMMIYLMVAVAGVTHRDLLLETPVELPILQVHIQLTQFFRFAPVVLVLLHMGLVAQLVLLARKALELDRSIRLLEATDRRTHPLRLELHNFFFVQSMAGPHRSAVLGSFLHGFSWLTVVILPVVLLLYIQVSFLPYHDVSITWLHRCTLVFDILLLMSIGIFLSRAESSFFKAFFRASASNPFTVVLTSIVLVLVSAFSFLTATIPGEALDRVSRALLASGRGTAGAADRFVLPFLAGSVDGTLFGIFHRNLVVNDTDLVVDKDVSPGEPSLRFRGRDLRYAHLERSDLHQADFTSARLDHARLSGADLRGIWLQCPDLGTMRLQGKALCPSAVGADFTKAQLQEAHLSGTDLTGASFAYARLAAADLRDATLTGADFGNAELDRADLSGGVRAQGASFLVATLLGADLSGAKLQGADFTYAQMQGALLTQARLEGAKLRNVDLEGASLAEANLTGASLAGARIDGADLNGARIWLSEPPLVDASGVADTSDLAVRAPEKADLAALKAEIDTIADAQVRGYVGDRLEPLANADDSGKWSTSPDQVRWQDLMKASQAAMPDYRQRLTDYLAKMACKPRWNAGNVATGVARRALAPQFRGSVVALYDRLKSDECPASKTIASKVVKDLSMAADQARGD